MRCRVAVGLGWGLLLALASCLLAAEPGYQLSVVTDPPDAICTVGQPAKFLVTLKQGEQPVSAADVVCTLDKDGMPPVTETRLTLDKGTATMEGTLGEPGFLRCRVSCAGQDKQVLTATAGAAFDPLKIPPSLPVPEDFDAFWTQQKARLASVPMEPKLTPFKSPVDGIECFDTEISCVPPRPVSGYFARPLAAALQSLPAILLVHGAGVRSSSLSGAAGSAKRFHALALDINAHGITNGKPDAFYQDLAAGELKDYRTAGREDRENAYNNLPGKKQIVNEPLMGHAVSPQMERATEAAIDQHIAAKTASRALP